MGGPVWPAVRLLPALCPREALLDGRVPRLLGLRTGTPVTRNKRERQEGSFLTPACAPSFLEMMEARSRGHTSPLAANGQSPSSGSQSPVVPVSAVSTGSSSPSTPQPAPQLPLPTPSACPSPPSPSEAPLPPAPPVAPAPAPRRSIISRLFGTSPAAEVAPPPPGRPQGAPQQVWAAQVLMAPSPWPCELPQTGTGSPSSWVGSVTAQSQANPCLRPGPAGTDPVPAAEAPAKVQDVEEFVPGDGLDHSFLDDVAPPKEERTVEAEAPQDSDR